ncbi:MAG: hypothetical protein PHY14_01990 [Candidatus Gracilibacteria bacterium]|nr:hypothetical protein [Candidatus Gracilibacteria bacterium]
MAELGKLAGVLATTVALAGNPQAQEAADFSALAESGYPGVSEVISNTQSRMIPLAEETKPILLAQANVETDGKVYVAYVIQQDGSKKEVKYTKSAQGIIQPPITNNGKLVDGSSSTGDEGKDRRMNRSILVKYDKDSQVLLALVDKNDIIRKTQRDLETLVKLVESGKEITREQLFKGFIAAYIYVNAGKDAKGMIQGMETIAKIKLKMSDKEISDLKKDASKQATDMWIGATGALG